MKNSFILILILSISLSACKQADYTDHSLGLDEYLELGMPDHNRVWGLEDYSTAFYVLNTLKFERPYTLPNRESERSGMLFSRMINIENLAFLQDDTLPLWAKADMIKWFVNTLMELKVVYTIVGKERQYYARELMDIDIFRVSVSHKMLELGQLINESHDPSDVAMKADYPHIQNMYVGILSELLTEQQKISQYPTETLELLSDSISASVRMNMGWFDKKASDMVSQGMRNVIEITPSRKIRSEYGALLELL